METIHSWTPLPITRKGFQVFLILSKRKCSDVFHKKGGCFFLLSAKNQFHKYPSFLIITNPL